MKYDSSDEGGVDGEKWENAGFKSNECEAKIY